MSLPRLCKLLKLGPGFKKERNGLVVFDIGDTVPSDGDNGYEKGCIFIHTDGSAGTMTYINEGSTTSCNFNPSAALTAAQEALLGATAGTATASKAVVLDSSGELSSGTVQFQAGMSPGAGITGGTNTQCEHSVSKIGDLYKTEILVNIDGLQDSGTAGDIIGNDGTSNNCNIGQITAAVNGTVTAGKVSCLEVPGTGGTDIDLYSADEATGSENDAISGLTNSTQLIDHGSWSAGDVDEIESMPSADQYLYLVAQSGSGDATYTTGIFLIELWGV